MTRCDSGFLIMLTWAVCAILRDFPGMYWTGNQVQPGVLSDVPVPMITQSDKMTIVKMIAEYKKIEQLFVANALVLCWGIPQS